MNKKSKKIDFNEGIVLDAIVDFFHGNFLANHSERSTFTNMESTYIIEARSNDEIVIKKVR